jgi:hypothetical protein
MAVNKEIRDALMQYSPYHSEENDRSEYEHEYDDHHDEYDGSHRHHHHHRELTVKEKAALAAIKDPILAIQPKVRELFRGIVEPVMSKKREA